MARIEFRKKGEPSKKSSYVPTHIKLKRFLYTSLGLNLILIIILLLSK